MYDHTVDVDLVYKSGRCNEGWGGSCVQGDECVWILGATDC